MLGAIIGDIVGSIYEFNNIKSKDFIFFDPCCYFTDDTVLTAAVAYALIKCNGDYSKLASLTAKSFKKWGRMYPNAGYGLGFYNWLFSKDDSPYNSYGNGSAMRVSPVAYFAKDENEVKELSYKVTAVTHNHPEGIKGAEATAMAIFLALNHNTKQQIKDYIEKNYYSLDFDYLKLKENYRFNETCQNTVPQAIYCFLISESFEDAIRTGISIGGDSDTLCAIIGGIAEAYYGIPKNIQQSALKFLDEKIIKIYNMFKRATKDLKN